MAKSESVSGLICSIFILSAGMIHGRPFSLSLMYLSAILARPSGLCISSEKPSTLTIIDGLGDSMSACRVACVCRMERTTSKSATS